MNYYHQRFSQNKVNNAYWGVQKVRGLNELERAEVVAQVLRRIPLKERELLAKELQTIAHEIYLGQEEKDAESSPTLVD